jgi:hypothetical protein
MTLQELCESVLELDRSGDAPSYKYRESASTLAKACQIMYSALEQISHGPDMDFPDNYKTDCEEESREVLRTVNLFVENK